MSKQANPYDRETPATNNWYVVYIPEYYQGDHRRIRNNGERVMLWSEGATSRLAAEMDREAALRDNPRTRPSEVLVMHRSELARADRSEMNGLSGMCRCR